AGPIARPSSAARTDATAGRWTQDRRLRAAFCLWLPGSFSDGCLGYESAKPALFRRQATIRKKDARVFGPILWSQRRLRPAIPVSLHADEGRGMIARRDGAEPEKASLEVLLSPAEFAVLPRRDLSRTVCVVFDVLRATS